MTRFIHTSDWQLGMTRHFLSAEASARFSQARIDAITRLGELARTHDAQFIVVAGDVFESNQLTRQTVRRTLDALEALPVPVFLLPGNHDPLDGSSIFLTTEFRAAGNHIQVLTDTQPIAVPGLEGIEVVGAPWTTKHPSNDLCANMLANLEPAGDVIRVAVAHGQLDTLAPDASRPEIIDLANAESHIIAQRIHYLALGDRHSVTNTGTTGRIWYSGAPVATDFDEVDPNNALLVDVTTEACVVETLTVGDWRFIAHHEQMNGAEDLKRFREWLMRLPDKARSILKVSFTGSVNLAIAAQLDTLFETQAESFASLAWRSRTTDLAILPDDLDEDSVELDGYAKAAWQELLTDAPNDETARNALRLFFRLASQDAAT